MKRFSFAHAMMVMPVQALLGLVIFLPSLYVLWLSLNESSFGQAPRWVGLANYIEVMSDPYFWQAFLNTVIVINDSAVTAGSRDGDAVTFVVGDGRTVRFVGRVATGCLMLGRAVASTGVQSDWNALRIE